MNVGDRVKILTGNYSGRVGTIEKISVGKTTGQLVAHIQLNTIPYLVCLFLYRLELIKKKPIKLKKFSVWK